MQAFDVKALRAQRFRVSALPLLRLLYSSACVSKRSGPGSWMRIRSTRECSALRVMNRERAYLLLFRQVFSIDACLWPGNIRPIMAAIRFDIIGSRGQHEDHTCKYLATRGDISVAIVDGSYYPSPIFVRTDHQVQLARHGQPLR